MKHLCLFLLLYMPFWAQAQNKVPVISNMVLKVNPTTKQLTVTYDVADAENDPIAMKMYVGTTDGKTVSQVSTATGDIGTNISAGKNKTISWNYAGAVPSEVLFKVTLVAEDGKTPSIADIVAQVDGNRMMDNLRFIAKAPRHRTSNPTQLQAVRDSISKYLLRTVKNIIVQDVSYSGSVGKNFIATQAGTVYGANAYMIDAHYDSVSNAPGADDNGSGVVGVLEAARILSQYQFKKPIKYAAFDFEEDGLIGSKAYAKNVTPNDIEGVLNFEMIGFYSDVANSQTLPTGFNVLFPAAYNAVKQDTFKGNFITNVGNVNANSLIEAFNNAATQYVPALKLVSVAVPGTGTVAPDLRRSDHASFWDKNIKALMLTDGANFRNKNYHEQSDTIGSINKAFMTNVVKATIATAATLAELDHSGKSSATFDITVSTKDIEPQCNFSISPNPVTDVLNINLGNCTTSQNNTIEFYDNTGKSLHRIETADKENINYNTSHLSKGMYIIRVNQAAKTFIVQ